ncbi:glycosyltransferase [Olivibacter sitiensis]|uniref:glycosyltransferase n=1 Tax=Olivibacter sitiensis TaxID=376470 RepID=UPI0004130067|nr:glycosyltransferase [Olivibacter sitiensis]
MKTFNLYIPTLNAGKRWPELIRSIKEQSLVPQKVIVLDSGSTDGTIELAKSAGFEIVPIAKGTFDHGGTRDYGIQCFPNAEVYVFMTHDAILANEQALAALIEAFDAPQIGMAYGRQLPHDDAKVLGAHARLFNYPPHSKVKSMNDIAEMGIKTISCSNSFAAYRREAYEQVGGFPTQIILGEDVVIAGKMLLQGWEMAYVAEAQAKHSHDYTVSEEFKRYFDIGVFHADTPFIFEHFGKADSEGFRFLKSEVTYVLNHRVLSLPQSFFSTLAKWLGYKMGLRYHSLPKRWLPTLSMQPRYWKL